MNNVNPAPAREGVQMPRQNPTAALRQDIADAINKHSRENDSNTPDFILAEYLLLCLSAWESGVRKRERWYGCTERPGDTPPPAQPAEDEADLDCVLQLSTPGGITHKLSVPHVTAAAIIRMHAGMCEPGAPHRFIMPGCYSIDLAAYSLVAASPTA